MGNLSPCCTSTFNHCSSYAYHTTLHYGTMLCTMATSWLESGFCVVFGNCHWTLQSPGTCIVVFCPIQKVVRVARFHSLPFPLAVYSTQVRCEAVQVYFLWPEEKEELGRSKATASSMLHCILYTRLQLGSFCVTRQGFPLWGYPAGREP